MRHGWLRKFLAGGIFVMLLAPLALAQTTQPGKGLFDNVPIGAAARNAASPPSGRTLQTTNGTAKGVGGFLDLGRVGFALAVVIGLILIFRWTGGRLFPNVIANARSTQLVRVLGRSPVSPKQQVVLLQVGRRILVVGDNGSQLSALSAITDRDEVAELLGRVKGGGGESSDAFAAALSESNRDFQRQTEAALATHANPSSTAPAGDLSPTDGRNALGTSSEAGAAEAQSEIAGLMERVRGLAQQLGRN